MLRRNFLQSLPVMVGLSNISEPVKQRKGLLLEHFNVLGEYIYAPCNVLITPLGITLPSQERQGKYELSFNECGRLIYVCGTITDQNNHNYLSQHTTKDIHGVSHYLSDSSVEPEITYHFVNGYLKEVFSQKVDKSGLQFRLTHYLKFIKELGRNPKTTSCPPMSALKLLDSGYQTLVGVGV